MKLYQPGSEPESIRKTRLYLAGPMRGKPEYNFPAFHAATKRLRDIGFEVWSPAENDMTQDGFDPKTDQAREMSHYMKRDLPEVCHADAVAVLPGWEKSQGATLEVHVCRAIGHPVIDALTLAEVPMLTQAEAEVCDGREAMRVFTTGATRHNDNSKLDYEGFLSPMALDAYAQYLNKHRVQADGKLRASDNWQLGIPRDVYIKSLFRHFVDAWKLHRGYRVDGVTIEDALSAVLFNAFGYLHEHLKANDQDMSDRSANNQ